MGTSCRPAASSASRMARTRPSIMSEGATMSAPAATWDTAARASSGSVASLSTSQAQPPALRGPQALPSGRTGPSLSMPQWPWEVYSHRHTSVTMKSSGCSAFACRTARCTMPSGS